MFRAYIADNFYGKANYMELKKVDSNNIWDIVELKVCDDQRGFVASNTDSILEAFATREDGFPALPFGLYEQNELVGFVMIGYGTTGDEDEPKIADGNYCVWRFMIDASRQGRGLGRRGMLAAIDYIKTLPCGNAEYIWLSYEPENARAKRLYTSLGFSENGEVCSDEIVSVLKI